MFQEVRDGVYSQGHGAEPQAKEDLVAVVQDEDRLQVVRLPRGHEGRARLEDEPQVDGEDGEDGQGRAHEEPRVHHGINFRLLHNIMVVAHHCLHDARHVVRRREPRGPR